MSVPTEAELARAEGRSFESAAEMLKRVKSMGAVGKKAASNRRGRSA